MALSQPFVRLSNIEKYTPMLSSDDIMQKMLNPQANFFESFNKLQGVNFKPGDINKLQEISAQVLTTVFHTMTTNAATTKEILETIYDQCDKFIFENGVEGRDASTYKEVIVLYISQYIKFVHEDYKIVTDASTNTETLLSNTNFCIPKTQPKNKSYTKTVTVKKGKTKKIKTDYFQHDSQFGLIAYEIDKKKKLVVDSTVTLTGPESKSRDKIFTVRNVVESKLVEELGSLKTKGKVDAEGRIDLDNYLNATDGDNQLKIGKDNTSLSYILMNNPEIRTGTKNSLEIATFLNNLSTFELSKCYPYLDVKFLLPEFVTTKSSKIYKTASVVEFLKGTPISDDATGNTYKVLEAAYIKKDIKTSKETIKQPAVETNMSAFTMPQTAVNFDETFVGHLESYSDSKNNLVKAESAIFERNNIVHDYTKPFLTIKSFNVDIAPTAGLMSFKTGRLSMTLHDKTRMADIAPFIKPDLFGSFGAEIAIQYGWSHMDAMSNMTKTLKETFVPNKDTNYFAEFLDTNKVYEKYIITNSSYSIDANGQVNIDLSIAMKGPIEIRSITFETDQPKQINIKSLERLAERLIKNVYSLSGMDSQGKKIKNKSSGLTKFKLPTSGLINTINSVVQEYKSNTDPTSKGKLANINLYIKTVNNYTKNWRASGGTLGNNSKARLFHSLKAFEEFPTGLKITFAAKKGDLIKKAVTIAEYETKIDPATKKPSYKTFEEALDGANVPPGEIEKINLFYSNFVRFVRSASYAVSSGRKDLDQTIKTLLTKFTGGLSSEDPFFDKQNLSDIEMLKDKFAKSEYEKQKSSFCTPVKGIDINVTNDKRLTSYVSLGNFILALLGSHTAYSGMFDEIQIISYTLNDNAGLAANSNISSLLIDKNELESFIYELFKNGAQYTLESLFMQVVKKFVTTRYCVNYGLSDFYILDENNNVIPKNVEKQSEFQVNINERIKKIHEYRNNKFSKDKSLVSSIKFVMPKIKFLFDSMTRDTGSISVLRISIIDQHDNPFQSAQQILQDISEKGLSSAIYDINKRFIDLKSRAKDNEDIDELKKEYIQKNQKIIKILLKKGILITDSDGQYILNSTVSNGDLAVGIKNSLKTMMPSITYGTNNSAIIEASISTINEAKLNTVYITRPNRNSAPIKSKVKYSQDLPLRILPSQVNVTMFGCPFINFAQYLFLDFETNTTIDNQYIVTGLKHDITPGKFTTTLTLAYGDAYGKFETIVDTLNRTLKEIETGEIVTSKTVISKSGVEVIKDVSTGYDLTGNLSIPKLFPNLSTADEKAMGWAGSQVQATNPTSNLYGQDGVWSKDIIEIKGLDPVILRSHNTSDEDKLSYSIVIEKSDDNKVYCVKFKNVEYYYSAVKKSKRSFYIIDISKKLMSSNPSLKNKRKSLVYEILGDNFIIDDSLFYNKTGDKAIDAQILRTNKSPDGPVSDWRKYFDIFELINSTITWKGMDRNKKYGDKEVVFAKFFDSNVEFFFKLQDLVNTPYLVSKYTNDIKDISFEIKNYYSVLKHYDGDKDLFDKIKNLFNTIDKSTVFTDKRRSIRNVGGYELDNIETNIINDRLILTFKSKKQVSKKVKRKKIKKTLVMEIDLTSFVIMGKTIALTDAQLDYDASSAPDFLSAEIPEA